MQKVFKDLIWNIPTKNKTIYLTFDDGPDPEVTLWILNTLKKFDAKTTFFCIGENVQKHPAIFKQIIEDDHAVGNHTFNHLNGWKTKKEDYLKNIEKCAALIDSKLFRPPYGKLTPQQYSIINNPTLYGWSPVRVKYSIIMWDVLSGDFDKNTSKETCLKNVTANTKNGSIVVFHDNIKTKENLYYALPEFLEYFAAKGFKFKAIALR